MAVDAQPSGDECKAFRRHHVHDGVAARLL